MANETIELIKEWATERDLNAADPVKQLWKLVEENGELAAGVLKGKEEMIEDAAGDMVVVMTIMLMQLGGDIKNSFKDLEGQPLLSSLEDDKGMHFILDSILNMSECLQDKNDYDYGMENHMEDKVLDVLAGVASICRNHDLFIHECIDVAYNEIKDRKGKTINGSFVKEADL